MQKSDPRWGKVYRPTLKRELKALVCIAAAKRQISTEAWLEEAIREKVEREEAVEQQQQQGKGHRTYPGNPLLSCSLAGEA
jgi:hypothetical protein